MNSMFEKQPRAEALHKREQRSRMVVKDVPPTTPGTFQVTSRNFFFVVVVVFGFFFLHYITIAL